MGGEGPLLALSPEQESGQFVLFVVIFDNRNGANILGIEVIKEGSSDKVVFQDLLGPRIEISGHTGGEGGDDSHQNGRDDWRFHIEGLA